MMKDATAVIAGTETVTAVRTVNPPVYNGSTVLFDSYEAFRLAAAGRYEGITYGTDRLPTQRAFEQALCTLEGGTLTRAFQSGISAITQTLQAFTQTGDHILVCENVYGPTARFCRSVLSKYGIETTFVPAATGVDIADAIRPNTRLIFLESPGSNTFEIQDIPAITALAAKLGIITVLDNTWATPLYLKPFDLGVDVSIQSVTKYICGHSDILLGAATATEKYASMLADYYRVMEIFAPPADCAMALRGLRTLPVRLRQHEASALKIAHWLQSVACVDRVIHPALPQHPQHALWKRDFKGASGLFGFTFKQEPPEARLAAFVNRLEHFGIGYSWGGFKSLITAGQYPRSPESPYAGKTVVRLNIGLEDPEDLIADLGRGFDIMNTE